MKKILVIAAHPDDELLGCGGTILNHIDCKDSVDILILAEGATARYDKRPKGDDLAANALFDISIEVSKLLGANKPIFGKLYDNRMDSYEFLDIVKIVENVCNQIKPDIIYTHHGGDLNIDHQLTHRAVLTALRPTPNIKFESLFTFETLSSTEWFPRQQVSQFSPQHFVDISKYLDKKLEILNLYKTEINPFPHARSIEAVKSLALLRGSNVGLPAAEAFELVFNIKR